MAQVPSYSVQPIASFATSLSLRGVSQSGLMVGYQVLGGQIMPFVASQSSGMQVLPLPAGYVSGFANDVNSSGIIVGSIATNGLPFDSGIPAIWVPSGAGSWSVVIPQQFASLPSPLGQLGIQGGMAVAVNENDVIVGWSRYQGFQGGPSTRFSVAGPPVDLKVLGFQATITDLSDHTDLIVGDDLRMDLATGVVTNLGAPSQLPGFPGSYSTLAYSVNDSGQTIGAARRSTSLPDRYATFRHTDATGFTLHNPNLLLSPFIGFYDNNNRGDVAASGGLWFAAEAVLVPNVSSLLEPASAHWVVGLGYIQDDRRIYTVARNSLTGLDWLVVLEPKVCQQNLGFAGPGNATATLCGAGLGAGQASTYSVVGGPSLTFGVLALSAPGFPNLSVLGGTAVSFTGAVLLTVTTDASGTLALPITGVNAAGFDLVLQCVLYDAAQSAEFAFSNAIQAHLGN